MLRTTRRLRLEPCEDRSLPSTPTPTPHPPADSPAHVSTSNSPSETDNPSEYANSNKPEATPNQAVVVAAGEQVARLDEVDCFLAGIDPYNQR